MSLKDSNNNVKFSIPQNQQHETVKSRTNPHGNNTLLNQILVCYGCTTPINDQYLQNILDKYWHIQCLRCADCDRPLSGRCFERDGRLFCPSDYRRRVCTKCSLCLNVILPSELVRHSREASVFHLKCFFCVVCQKQLSTGDEYCLLEDFKPVCKEDFQNIFKEITDVTAQTCKNNLIKLETIPTNEDSNFNSPKDILNPSANSVKDIATFENQTFQASVCATSTGCSKKESHKFTFFDIMNIQQILPKEQNQTDYTSCQDTPVTRTSTNVNEKQHPAVKEDSLYCDISGKITDNDLTEAQLSTPEQTVKLPKGQNNHYDKDHEQSILDDDLKSSFSVVSSPESNIKDEDPNDGNISDQTFQDDQQSVCHTESREGAQSGNSGTKRRGPRTTIKAKQLDTLKAAFAATPKPTRHVREQLAQDTGLTMRVIQVWFQNRRSKERRMKQLSAMGTRRPFFRNARRMRSLSRGFCPDDMVTDGGQILGNSQYHGYFGDNSEFCNAIATLGGPFSSPNNYPLGHPALHRDFFLSNHNPPAFLNLNQAPSAHNSIQLPSSEGNQSHLVSGPLDGIFSPSDRFTSPTCTSPQIQFPQPSFNQISAHNLIPGSGYLRGPPIPTDAISRSQQIHNLSSLNFIQAPMVGMESW